ncbi:ribosomal protein L14b/L23e [Zopfochytrium polystomum]|nr:ribosomal protein L14b/L23e [Zopfochytrium polystomum]
MTVWARSCPNVLLKSLLKVIDNSGALVVECINVLGGARTASIGDEIVCVVKKARPITDLGASSSTGGSASSAAAGAMTKLKKGDVARALVVRTRQPVRRLDGTFVAFDDNAVVMLNKQGQPVGNRVLGVIGSECRQKRWAKIASLAPKIV